MKLHCGCGLTFACLLVGLTTVTLSIPLNNGSREKRSGISDQRVAELQTLIALAKIKNRRPQVGFGVVDPMKVGKRKRSNDMMNLDELSDLFNDQLSENEAANNWQLWDTFANLRRFNNREYR